MVMERKKQKSRLSALFQKMSNKVTKATGSPYAFLIALTVVIVWAITGPIFGFSDTWQLVINTGTTIITFLMVFLIQNTQNRDAKAMHLKLDELIDATKAARNEMIDIEELSDEKLQEIAEFFKKKREEYDTEGVKEVAKGTAEKVASDTAKKVAEDTTKRVA
jgi:low affinity Fe/Cu permease